MSASTPFPLGYRAPGSTDYVSRWIPLAKTIAFIAVAAGLFFVAKNIDTLIRWTSLPPGKSKLPHTIRLNTILSLAAGILLVLGGILSLLRRSLGRILLLISLAWQVYGSASTLVAISLHKGHYYISPLAQANMLGACIGMEFYAVLACVVILRRGIFR